MSIKRFSVELFIVKVQDSDFHNKNILSVMFGEFTTLMRSSMVDMPFLVKKKYYKIIDIKKTETIALK